MLPTPVLYHAVETSPHGIVVASTGPEPKSIVRVRHAAGTVSITPLRRTAPPFPLFSSIVRAVPRDTPPAASKASARRLAVGSRLTRCAARQSDGTTSKPTP